MPTRKTWLVCADLEAADAYSCVALRHGRGFTVEADDEVAAAKVVCGITGRVGKFSVVPAVVIDLGAGDPRGGSLLDEIQRHR